MTNEEAVKMLRTMQRTVYLGNRKFEDAIECAIKALSEPLQPWEVLVAQAVLPHPEPHWIPVTEEPKEEKKSYWVCLEDGGQCQCRWTNDIYGIGANAWSKWGWKKADLPQFSKVVAYMPLPEPYKGVTE